MRFNARFGIPFLLLLAAGAALAADSGIPSYVPPDTRVVVGLRVRAIIDLLSQEGADIRASAAGMLAQTPLAGLDPTRDLDEILLFTTGEGANPPMLVVVTGRFDVEHLSANAKPYRGVPILEGVGSSQQVIALLDGATAIAGEPAMVRAAIDRRGAGAGLNPALAARAELLRSRYDIWGTGSAPEGAAQPKAANGPFQSMDRFEFGAALSHGLEFTADLHLRSAEEAQKMTDTLRLLESLVKTQQPSVSAAKFDLQTARDGTLKLSLAIPEEELKKAIQAQRATLASALAGQMGATRPAPKPEAKTTTDSKGDTVVVKLPGK